MSRQYLRTGNLIVSPEGGGEGLDLSALHYTFSIKQQNKSAPNAAHIRVFNLAPETSQKIEKEFTRIALQVGYQGGDQGVIFDGTIIQLRRGKLNATDSFLDITAADGDQAYNLAVVSASMAAGVTAEQQLAAITKAMEKYHVTLSPTGPDNALPVTALPRGKVLHGMARDYMDDLTNTSQTYWSIQNGKVTIVKRGGFLPTDAVVLNARTGLIGLPTQTADGINVRCLINPNIKPSVRIKIDNKSIQRAEVNVDYSALQFLPRVDDDGTYRVVVIEHEGDSRGTDWYSDIICVAVDDAVTTSLAQRGFA